ncbi:MULTISPECIES: HNH endonuclease [Erythrobacter]|uniref:HNH endonuclease n=1 Tax=Erythrobacter TaxID=1041 RepID=UPI001F447A5A|nr:HNH endonuclease [Erythrobacter sp. SN021]
MSLVSSRAALLANLRTFAAALNGTRGEREFAGTLVRKGHVYYPFKFNGVIGFAPSKFIGYGGNSIETYRRTIPTRSGSVSTAKISRVLKSMPETSSMREKQLADFCAGLGVGLADYAHTFWMVKPANLTEPFQSAIDDLAEADLENDDPEYQQRMSGHYVRSEKVRRKVLKRANGKCEYCGTSAFLSVGGSSFVECHHVISLSEQGPDKVSNVIALCPNHHREAHFGRNWENLQTKFLGILEEINK